MSLTETALPEVSTSIAEIEQRIEQIARHGYFVNFQRTCREHARYAARGSRTQEAAFNHLRDHARFLPLDAAAIDHVIARALEAEGVPSAPPLQPDREQSEPVSMAASPEPPADKSPA